MSKRKIKCLLLLTFTLLTSCARDNDDPLASHGPAAYESKLVSQTFVDLGHPGYIHTPELICEADSLHIPILIHHPSTGQNYPYQLFHAWFGTYLNANKAEVTLIWDINYLTITDCYLWTGSVKDAPPLNANGTPDFSSGTWISHKFANQVNKFTMVYPAANMNFSKQVVVALKILHNGVPITLFTAPFIHHSSTACCN